MDKYASGSRAWMWFVASLAASFVAGCGEGIFGTGSGVIPGAPPAAVVPGACVVVASPTTPTVTSSNPTNGNLSATTSTSSVAPSKLITATFSLPMLGTSITATSFTLAIVGQPVLAGTTVTYNAATNVASLTTAAALLPNTSYTAVITQDAVTLTGTPLSCTFAWNFSTGALATGIGPINLGLATPFAIASFSGITNSGATKINGDVVLNPNDTCNAVVVGSGNDFGPCPANPPTNNAGDRVITDLFPGGGVADAISTDLTATWNNIAPALLPLGTVLGCGTIGTGGGAGAGIGCAGNATLPPAVYISATGSSIGVTGDLTLDGGGNADAVWVFQAPVSTVDAAANSRILLINGAKASNVWWHVGSTATFVTAAEFQGNVLAAASIILGTGVTSCGRLLSGAAGAGSLTMLANTVSVPGHPNAPVGCQ